MSFSNYTGLIAAVADYLERDDLTSQVADFVVLGEARIKRDIRIREMLTRAALTVNARQISVPTGLLQADTIRLLTDPVTVLQELPLFEMNRVRDAGTGKPAYFTIHKEIEFNVTPDSSYSGEIVYYAAFDPLTTTATNSLLSLAPDVYLYSSLLAAAPFLLDDARVQLWAELYKEAKDSLNQMSHRQRHVGPLVSRVVGRGP